MSNKPGVTAPCSWPVDYSACSSCPPLEVDEDASSEEVEAVAGLRAMAEDMATAYLWAWTGGIFGECEVVLRPCRSDCSPGGTVFRGHGPFTGGYFSSVEGPICGECGPTSPCSCDGADSIVLPGPVSRIDRVVVDGVALPAKAYRLDGARLWRTDGERWPVCQSLGADLTEQGTWAVEYRQGLPVPTGGRLAAGVLACELAKALCGVECGLPARWQSVTRQGVSVARTEEAGQTGLWLVDSWVSSITKPQRRLWGVYSPDVRVRR